MITKHACWRQGDILLVKMNADAIPEPFTVKEWDALQPEVCYILSVSTVSINIRISLNLSSMNLHCNVLADRESQPCSLGERRPCAARRGCAILRPVRILVINSGHMKATIQSLLPCTPAGRSWSGGGRGSSTIRSSSVCGIRSNMRTHFLNISLPRTRPEGDSSTSDLVHI